MVKPRLLIFDTTLNFIRAFIADPSISNKGLPIGGIKGTLRILQKLCRETNPNKIIFCLDGKGGSTRRKSISKSYKDGRKPLHLNRNIKMLTEQEDLENKIWQMTRL